MKVSGSTIHSPIARTAIICSSDQDFEKRSNLSCEANVFIANAFLSSDVQLNGLPRPFLKMMGVVSSLQGNFPCDVSEVLFERPTSKPEVHYEYHFTDEELAQLCAKGLFQQGFRCPDIFLGNDFLLPLSCDCMALPPQSITDAPLLFLDLKNQYNLIITKENSGYDLASYFEELKKPEVLIKQEELMNVVEHDLIKDVLFEEPVSVTEPIIEIEPIAEPIELSAEDESLRTMYTNIEQRVSTKIADDLIQKPHVLPNDIEEIYQKGMDADLLLDRDATDE